VHKLLYFAQGHHLAATGRASFYEAIDCWDNGPVVAELWRAEEYGHPVPPPSELGEGELNTVGYVLSRYGALSPRDLINLTHSQDPWKLANAGRSPGTSKLIHQSWISDYFLGDEQQGQETVPLDAGEVAKWLAGASANSHLDGPVDDSTRIAERIRELRELAAS
jgi:uncharacterized phage-associated protein